MTFETFLFIVAALYVVQVSVFVLGLARTKDATGPHVPFVSIVIAARDEEKDISACLESVLNQTYPIDKFEVIVVNDNSSDATDRICREYAERHRNVSTFVARENPQLRGKPNVLAEGIDRAKGEVILITDADCLVPPTWVDHTAKRYSNDVGLVGGMTLQRAGKPFEGMQSLDWTYLLGIAASSAAFGNPLGSIGNNLSFRKAAYEAVGGYRKLKFSVTEDYTLVQAIVGLKKWNYLYPIDPNLLVESQPCPDFVTLVRQKHRWGKGGLDVKLIGYLIMAVGWTMHASLFINLYWGGVAQSVVAFMIKFIADYFFLENVLRRLNRKDELRYFYWFELYYTLYVIILPFLVLLGGKVRWKGRTY